MTISQAVLNAYSEIRQPRSQTVWDASYNAGRIYDHHGPHEGALVDMAEDLRDLWKPVWLYDTDRDIETAISALRANATFNN